MLGRSPITDFDGTLARLPVAWEALRIQLRVRRLADLWEREDAVRCWQVVRNAEVAAAREAVPIDAVGSRLQRADAFAILTSNAEDSVLEFLEHFPKLRSRCACVVGRETLGGPKDDFRIFRRGFDLCVAATAHARAEAAIEFVGNED